MRQFLSSVVLTILLATGSFAASAFNVVGRSDTAKVDTSKSLIIEGDILISMSDYSSARRIIKNLDTLEVDGKTTLDTLTVTGESFLDTLSVTGPTTLDTVTSTSLAILDTARIDSATFSKLTAIGQVSFSAATSVLMPAAITMPSGTDGYVLTSDGNGRVILEAVAASEGSSALLSDTARVILPDSTLTVNAHGEFIFVGDLNDPEIMWDKAAFRALSKGTSWQKEVGHWPERFTIEIDTVGTDSLRIRNRDDMSVWMVFVGGSGSMIPASATAAAKFIDGILYVPTPSRFIEIDFARDMAFQYQTGGKGVFEDPISGRNSSNGANTISTSLAIVNSTVNCVGAIRDPFGSFMSDGSNRPAQWWVVGTATGAHWSVYNPNTDAIYDGSGSWEHACQIPGNAIFLADGSYYYNGSTDAGGSGRDHIYYHSTMLDIDANEGNHKRRIVYNSSTPEAVDLDWGDSAIHSAIAHAGPSMAENAQKRILVSSNEGLYQIHYDVMDCPQGQSGNCGSLGAKVRMEAGIHNPYAKGDAFGVYALEDLTDASTEGLDLSKVGTTDAMAGTITGVFGTAYSSTEAGTHSFLHKEGSSEFNDPQSMNAWFKTDDTANGGSQYIIDLRDETGANDLQMSVNINSSGYLYVILWGGGASQETITGATDVDDNEWHHVAVSHEGLGDAAGLASLYLDGELHNTNSGLTNVTAGSINTDTLYVGANNTGGPGVATNWFDGFIDQVAVSRTPLSATEVRAIYNDGIKAMQTTEHGLASTDIDYIHTKDGYVALGNEDSLQVFVQGATTIFEQFREITPGGAIVDAAVWQEPGTDSASYAIITPTTLKIVQRDPYVLSAANHKWTWVQPNALVGGATMVDSSGRQGIFWEGQDATDASFTAGIGRVQFAAGTYTGMEADHDGMVFTGVGRCGQTLGAIANCTLLHGYLLEDFSVWDEGFLGTGDYGTVRDMSFYTTGGLGGEQDAISITGDYWMLDNIGTIDSDLSGISLTSGTGGHVTNSFVWSSDGQGIFTNQNKSTISNNYTLRTIYFQTGADNSNATGNHDVAGFYFASTSDNSIVDGHITDAGVTDSGTGNTNGDVETY